MKKQNGIFIVCEGIDGSGKTTLAQGIYNHYNSLLPDKVFLTQQPGGSEIGREIRTLLKKYYNSNYKIPETEFLLFCADRAQNIHECIYPNLKNGAIVISDRFIDSSKVYQGYLQGLSNNFIDSINNLIIKDLKPDITFYCKIDINTIEERIKNRGSQEMFDLTKRAEKEKIIEGYNLLYKNSNKTIVTLDASKKIEDVLADALTYLNNYLKQKIR